MPHSSVSQGLQSCLEPRHIEPRVLRLRLAPPVSNHSSQSEWPNSNGSSSTNASFSNSKEAYENPTSDNNTSNEHDMEKVKDSSESGGGCTWSFLQSLSNISHCNNKAEAESVYVHPKVKCSSSMLSEKSLEMCTESLGCETGSNASESSDDTSSFPLENSTSFMSNSTIQVNTNYEPKRLNRRNNFPPPLTSITDLGGLRVRPHREGGRLILEAVTTASFQPYFHAERSNGRLRLRLYESAASYCGDDEGEVADDEEEEEEEEEVEEEEEEEEGETMNNEARGEEENEEGLEKHVASVEDEMGMAKFTTPSRCKESGRNRDIFGDGYFELPSLSLCL